MIGLRHRYCSTNINYNKNVYKREFIGDMIIVYHLIYGLVILYQGVYISIKLQKKQKLIIILHLYVC